MIVANFGKEDTAQAVPQAPRLRSMTFDGKTGQALSVTLDGKTVKIKNPDSSPAPNVWERNYRDCIFTKI